MSTVKRFFLGRRPFARRHCVPIVIDHPVDPPKKPLKILKNYANLFPCFETRANRSFGDLAGVLHDPGPRCLPGQLLHLCGKPPTPATPEP